MVCLGCVRQIVVGGDFNVNGFASKKLNGDGVSRRMRDFDAFITNCELVDPDGT